MEAKGKVPGGETVKKKVKKQVETAVGKELEKIVEAEVEKVETVVEAEVEKAVEEAVGKELGKVVDKEFGKKNGKALGIKGGPVIDFGPGNYCVGHFSKAGSTEKVFAACRVTPANACPVNYTPENCTLLLGVQKVMLF